MTHMSTVVDLPRQGLVLLTGDNGSGKSTIAPEAVAFGIWGKTLRGSDPWRIGEPGELHLELQGYEITRTVTKAGGKKLRWSRNGVPETYDTSAKAQAGLVEALGEFELWRRRHVFSSQDAAHFSTATDSERKYLIERLLGLEKLDAAHTKVGADRKAAQLKASNALTAVAYAKGRYTTALGVLEARLAQAEEPMPEQPNAAPDAAALEVAAAQAQLAYDEACADAHSFAGEAHVRAARLECALAEAKAELRHAEAAARLSRAGKCPTCGQGVEDHGEIATSEAAQAKLRKAEEALRRSTELDTEDLAALRAAVKPLQVEAANAQHALSQIRVLQARYDAWSQACGAWAKRRAARDAEIAHYTAEVEAHKAALDAAEAAHAETQAEVEILEACEAVLGVRGVRGSVITGALVGLETMANSWLSRLGKPDLRVELRPYTESKSGTVADSISLLVHGAGGGHGYKGASGGERRRIDIALLLALADFSGGVGSGSLFFDEVGDTLDPSGISGFCAVLQELAETRCVVVISHQRDMFAELRPTHHWHVVDGAIT